MQAISPVYHTIPLRVSSFQLLNFSILRTKARWRRGRVRTWKRSRPVTGAKTPWPLLLDGDPIPLLGASKKRCLYHGQKQMESTRASNARCHKFEGAIAPKTTQTDLFWGVMSFFKAPYRSSQQITDMYGKCWRATCTSLTRTMFWSLLIWGLVNIYSKQKSELGMGIEDSRWILGANAVPNLHPCPYHPT